MQEADLACALIEIALIIDQRAIEIAFVDIDRRMRLMRGQRDERRFRQYAKTFEKGRQAGIGEREMEPEEPVLRQRLYLVIRQGTRRGRTLMKMIGPDKAGDLRGGQMHVGYPFSDQVNAGRLGAVYARFGLRVERSGVKLF